MLHLDLQPEIEAQLAAEAAARGLQPDRYVADLLSAFLTRHEADAQPHLAASTPDDERLDRELQEGLDDIAAGRTRPARGVFAELDAQYGISA